MSDRLVAWRPADPGEEPGGWEWLYELEPHGDDQTLVTETFSWKDVADDELRASFPKLPAPVLEQSLARLAELVGGKKR